jgi:hypothetical protein
MFKKDFSYVDDYIKSCEQKGQALLATLLSDIKRELMENQSTIAALRQELRKYKPPGRKKK